MRPRWKQCVLFLGIGAQAMLLASCEAIIGIHSPPSFVADAGNGNDRLKTDGGAEAAAQDPLTDGLVLRYSFDDATSTTTVDSAAKDGIARNATLVSSEAGSALLSIDRQVGSHSLELTNAGPTPGGYATTLPTPGLKDLAPLALTISVWVFVGESRSWQRVFDFGAWETTPARYMFLSPSRPDKTSGTVHFAISREGLAGEQAIEGSTLSLNTWHHLAIVLPEGSPYTGRLYVDGMLQGVNANMTLHAADLGATDQNFLGLSQFPVDPSFVGKLDDFRIYARALSEADVLRLTKLH